MYSNGESWIEVRHGRPCAATWVPSPSAPERPRLPPQVGRTRSYTPIPDDVAYVIKYECSVVDTLQPNAEPTKGASVITSRVRPEAKLPNRSLLPILPPAALQPTGRFTVLSYNLLADLYAKARLPPALMLQIGAAAAAAAPSRQF